MKRKLKKCQQGGMPCIDPDTGLEIPCPDNGTEFFQTGWDNSLLSGARPIPFDINSNIVQSNFNRNKISNMNNNQILNQKSKRTFGLNFDHIMPSTIAKNFLSGLSNNSANSQQNAIKNFNKKQFNPLNYLPYNPNYSLQDYYGMDYAKKGGMATGGFLDDFTNNFLSFENDEQKAEERVIKKDKKKYVENYESDEIFNFDTMPVEARKNLEDLSDTFRDKIAWKESNNNYKAESKYSSAVGKYQFLWKTWANEIKNVTKVKSKEDFKNNPQAQEDFMDYYENNILSSQVVKLAPLAQNYSKDQLKALIHFKGFGGAKTFLTTGKDKISSNNSSIPEYINNFKKGGMYSEGGPTLPKEWYTSWINSPMYKTMNEGKQDFSKQRLDQLEKLHTLYVPQSQISEKSDNKSGNLGYYDKKDFSININNKRAYESLRPMIEIHEWSHGVDHGGDYIPIEDVNIIKKNHDEMEPSEIRALINQARWEYQKKGTYDPYKEKFDSKFLDNKNNGIRNLRKFYSDEEITNLLNSVSQNSKEQKLQIAKKGGFIKNNNHQEYEEGGEYDIDEIELERLKSLGYKFEIIK